MTALTRGLLTSSIVNVLLFAVIAWYVIFHVGIGKITARFRSPSESFLSDVYYRATADRYRELNARLDPSHKYVVFAGDSLVAQFPVHELFQDGHVLNRGIGSDTTRGLKERLESTVTNLPLGFCVLLIGSNDLDYRSVEETGRNMDLILRNIDPHRVIVVAVPPCSDAEQNRRIKALNKEFEHLAVVLGSRFVDSYTPLLGPDQVLRKEYTYDGVHLTLAGYQVLEGLIKPFISVEPFPTKDRESNADTLRRNARVE